MRRFIAALLCLSMILAGCSSPAHRNGGNITTTSTTSWIEPLNTLEEGNDGEDESLGFAELSDPELLAYIEDEVYADLIESLNSDKFFVENICTIYVSDEYLEELAYNSQANIYFGYTLAELDDYFQDTKYLFTLGDDGQTTVQPFEAYDDTYDQVIKNVAVGTGVILLCVTVSVITGGSAPAVSLIFAASAKSGTAFALSSGAFSGLAAGVVKGIETKDFDESVKAAALAGSKGFKWGAIAGSVSGGVAETFALKGATLNGLTMNQAAQIQKESGLPLAFIKNFRSMDEYNVYKSAHLLPAKVNGQWAYTRSINWEKLDSNGYSNIDRVTRGLSPLDQTGAPYELHHIGQKADSPLAILTRAEHHGYSRILHTPTASTIDRTVFAAERQAFWKALLELTYPVA